MVYKVVQLVGYVFSPCWVLLLVCGQQVSAAEQLTSISIASQNLYRLFDDQDDPRLKEKIHSSEYYQARLQSIADHFRDEFDCPDILLLQEVENKQVLEALSKKTCVGTKTYRTILEEGFDASGIDVGALLDSNIHLLSWQQLAVTQDFSRRNLPLYTRPPLLIRFSPSQESEIVFTIVVVHLRSMLGLDGRHHQRISSKRRQQAQWLASWVQQHLEQNDQEYLLIAGDFNATENDQDPENTLTIIKNSYGVDENGPVRLKNLNQLLPKARRYTYIYQGQKQALDHVLVSHSVWPLISDYKIIDMFGAQRISGPGHPYSSPLLDHNGLLLELKVP